MDRLFTYVLQIAFRLAESVTGYAKARRKQDAGRSGKMTEELSV